MVIAMVKYTLMHCCLFVSACAFFLHVHFFCNQSTPDGGSDLDNGDMKIYASAKLPKVRLSPCFTENQSQCLFCFVAESG
jgi:hypothetical protein